MKVRKNIGERPRAPRRQGGEGPGQPVGADPRGARGAGGLRGRLLGPGLRRHGRDAERRHGRAHGELVGRASRGAHGVLLRLAAAEGMAPPQCGTGVPFLWECGHPRERATAVVAVLGF